MRRITKMMVVDTWSHMESVYQSSHTSKGDSTTMQMVGHFLNAVGILDKDKFLNRYTTTIGSIVYIPFKIGESDQEYSLFSQLSTCIHEHQHVVQWQRGGLSFMLEYLTDSSRRAAYEVEAMSSEIEYQWWYNRTLPSISRMAGKLVEYNCKSVDIQMAEKMLRTIAKTISKGAITTSAGETSIGYLNRMYV